MHRTASRHLLTVLLLITGAAATAAPGDDFRSGVDAFKQRRYEAALRYFEAAYAAGRHDAALLYNLGSAQYKLGNYPAAYTRSCASPTIQLGGRSRSTTSV